MSIDTVGTTLIRRSIARKFAELRAEAGLTQEEAARKIQRGRSTIVRIEDAVESVRFRDVDVLAMLDAYGADQETRDLLIALTAETRNGKKKSWWHDYTETELPEQMRLFIALEDSAETIRQYEPELVPGLLQTPQYAREIISILKGFATEEEVQARVALRLERQSILTRPRAPQLHAMLNEAVLRRPIGGNAVMAEQIEYLQKVIQKGNVIIRVVPYSVGAHAGAGASAFSMLDFPTQRGEPLEPPLVYVDTLTGAMYLNKSDEVAAYGLVWQDLQQRALDEKTSQQLLSDALKGFSNG